MQENLKYIAFFVILFVWKREKLSDHDIFHGFRLINFRAEKLLIKFHYRIANGPHEIFKYREYIRVDLVNRTEVCHSLYMKPHICRAGHAKATKRQQIFPEFL